MLNWIRRNFIAGFFVTVPLVISVAALVWIFRLIDGLVGPIYEAWLPGRIPGLGHPDDGAGGAAGGHDRHQRHRQARAAARRELPDAGAGVPHHLRARSSSSSSRSRPTTSTGSSAWRSSRIPRAGSCSGFLTKEFSVDRGQRPGVAAGRVRADESPVSRGRHHLPARQGELSRTSRWSRASGFF